MNNISNATTLHQLNLYYICRRIAKRMKFRQNKDIQSIVKVIFLTLFICYAGSITFFFHSHIINGVTIVHSHPYKADEKGNPLHTHTGSEIQLIQFLSSWHSVGKITFTFTFKVFQPYYIIKRASKTESVIKGFTNYFYLLRAPPSFYYN